MTIKRLGGKVQLFYDLRTINLISSSSAGRIKNLNKPHMAPGSEFAHAWTRQKL